MSELKARDVLPNYADVLNTKVIAKESDREILTKSLEEQAKEIVNEIQEWSEEKKEVVRKIIAKSIVDSCINLEIPIPDLEYGSEFPYGMHFDAKTYKIGIGEKRLRKLSINANNNYIFRAILFHECYHAWQTIHFPNRSAEYFLYLHKLIKKDDQKNKDQYEFYRLFSRYEVGAEMYALKNIKNVKTESAMQLLGKIQALIRVSIHLSSINLARRLKKDFKF